MIDTSEKIKSILYSVLENITEKKIQTKIAHGKSTELIEEVISRCISKIIELSGNANENIGVFAESLMHYLLTNALIPSQRKIMLDNIEIDVVIPDSKTLLSRPNDSLVIIFAKSDDMKQIEQRLQKLNKIQPQQNNIWVVSSQDLETNYKIYNVKRKNSFSKILDDIVTFTSSHGKMNFKILKTDLG